ncbi:MAG: hypothetical protein RID09_29030 [Coleofasciculus sp. G1-WW12-02]|uniref:hypothetical protein n=1 Tax=Coleofasciculus sp. G1-WW12-02 TaxID=3068483 RepID=UPI0032F52748
MNQKLKNRGQLLHQASPTDNQNVAVIHSLLNQWGADSSLASEFSQFRSSGTDAQNPTQSMV